ncbi:uncharacterized protein [Lepeophtheirus salmonis]|uniref:uncharacterized protein isoform X1 n=2 Tax=Lepeophtheirus salmonis TaxID=72036 RepID=UPI001AE803B9|nr:uncharacterized protein LOC121125669 isoform X2 [Lepeophtheirus salmonis]
MKEILFEKPYQIKLQTWTQRLRYENYRGKKIREIVASEMEELLLSKLELNSKKNSIVKNLIGKLRMEGAVSELNSPLLASAFCMEDVGNQDHCQGSSNPSPRWPYPKEIMVNRTFSCLQRLSDVTILLDLPVKSNLSDIVHLIQSIAESYSYVRIIAAIPTQFEDQLRKKIKYWINQVILVGINEGYSESYRWNSLIEMVETSMVMIGRDLDYFGSFSDLDRSIDLLNKYGHQILAVGGSRRLKDGHWINGCSQITIDTYAFKIQNGYKKSSCDDCMICSYIRGPFLTRTDRFKQIPLNKDISLAFIKWYYDHRLNTVSLSCPDLLYLTNDDLKNDLEGSREDWMSLGKALKFQAVIPHKRVQSEYQFSCHEIRIKCSPRSMADSFLLPYCCTRSYNFVIERLEFLASNLGIDYELNSGSLLGAVKLNNFIPWDIDGDIYIKTDHIVKFFDYGGSARKILERNGFTLTSIQENNYWDIGAKYFNLHFGGIEFEMQGRRNLTEKECSEFYHDQVCRNKTRVLVGHTWAKTHANPGRYARLRYGPGYLKHSTSWRYNIHQDNSFEKYQTSGQWNLCREEADHTCLDSYDGDGNINWLPSNYPGNE